MRRFPAVVVMACVMCAGARAQTMAAPASLAPETIFFHGVILTGARLAAGDRSTAQARVSAVAVRGGRVLAIGSDAEVLALKGPGTAVVDLGEAFAMPGFNDAHTHMASAGQQRLSVDLDGTASLAEMQARIKAYAATLRPGQWILGGGWDHTKWPGAVLPTRADVDAVSDGHPALLGRTDGHIAVANSAALAAAGISRATVAPAGSEIDHDAAGEPTGIVREAAARGMVERLVAKLDAGTRRKALELAIADALAHGVTTVQDFSEWDDFQVLEAMEREGKLGIRVSEWLPFDLPVATLKAMQASHPATDPWLHTTMLKGFMDGSLGSRTAALWKPYSDDAGNSGLPRYEQAKLNAMAAERAEAGFQLGFHAIGDRANSMALDAFAFAKAERMKTLQRLLPGLERSVGAGIRLSDASRYRIEHAQVLAPGDFDRFREMQIVASMQPSHLLTDMAWAGARLGPERVTYAYAWRSMLNRGVTLAFGTDYPVESISPMRGLYSAVTRRNEAGTQTFEPQETLTIAEALVAYTQGSAFAENAERTKGRLEPGYWADLVVLDHDLTKVAPEEILHTRVLRTVTGGVTRYQAPAGAAAERVWRGTADGD